jgi:MYXO-CTERM domain-containing protein
MQRIELRKIIASGILALALAFLPTDAQAQAGTGAQGDATTAPAEDDGGFDMGWLGLLGLAGLLGLRKKDDVHVTRVDSTAGTGSTRARV